MNVRNLEIEEIKVIHEVQNIRIHFSLWKRTIIIFKEQMIKSLTWDEVKF